MQDTKKRMREVGLSSPKRQRNARIAHAFWGSSGDVPMLPSYALVGLESAVAVFDRVVLWQYQDVPNAPEGVIKMDAAFLLVEAERDALMAKHVTIAHIADVVRFKAACAIGGWVIDADNLWLRPPPMDGFVFSTLWAKRSGGVAPSCNKWQAMKVEFAKEGWDGGDSINTPFSVVSKTPFAYALEALVDGFVIKHSKGLPWKKPPTKAQWNTLMWGLRDLVVEHHLGAYVRPPIEYGVSPYWHGFTEKILDGSFFDEPVAKRLKFGVQLPCTNEILTHAICVPTSFALGHGKHGGLDLRAFARARPTSLLGRVLAILPSL